MPFHFVLPQELSAQGWKVKIREKERVEPPHVSLMKRQETWRCGLRQQNFLDKRPPPRVVPKELVEFLTKNLEQLILNWDLMYPHNPVNSQDEK